LEAILDVAQQPFLLLIDQPVVLVRTEGLFQQQ
jgi:hypothetical protein